MPKINTTLDAEQAAFDAEVNEIKQWWQSSAKQRQLKRYISDPSSHLETAVCW